MSYVVHNRPLIIHRILHPIFPHFLENIPTVVISESSLSGDSELISVSRKCYSGQCISRSFPFASPNRIRFRKHFKRIAIFRSLRIAIIVGRVISCVIIHNCDIGIPTINVSKFYLNWGIIVFAPREVYLA